MVTGINSAVNNNYQAQAASKEINVKDKKAEGKVSSVSGYFQKLCDKYPKLKITVDDYVCKPQGRYTPGQYSNGSDSVWGNVHLNYQYLQKASQDPKTAVQLEEFLSGIPMAENWLNRLMTSENTEITEFGFGIGPNGETNSYIALRMPAKNSNFSVDRQSVIDDIQERNKAEVERRERENTRQPIKKQNTYDAWEDTMQDKILLKWEQARAKTGEMLKEERLQKMIQGREAYEQEFQQTSSFDLQR